MLFRVVVACIYANKEENAIIFLKQVHGLVIYFMSVIEFFPFSCIFKMLLYNREIIEVKLIMKISENSLNQVKVEQQQILARCNSEK